MVVAIVVGYSYSYFHDLETSLNDSMGAWTSTKWTQTSQADFNSGVSSNINTTTSPGDVLLAFTSSNIVVNSPTTNNGTWTNPTNAYADGGSYADILSGSPSGNQTYGDYGFSLGTTNITQVRVRTDAWTLAPTGLTTSKNPTANTNGTFPWTNPANGYTSDNLSATVSPTYGGTTSNNPTANTNGTFPWTNPANGYTSDNLSATVSPTYGGTTSNNPTANTNGTIPWTNPANGYTSNNSYATATVTSNIPTYRSAGTFTTGTGAVTPNLPSGMSANDIVILVASTIAGGSISITNNGSISTWTAVTGSPINVTGGEMLYVWWGLWSSGTTGPTLTPGGDHCFAMTVAYYNCYEGGSPIDVSATGTEATSDTSFSFATGLTSTYNNELAIAVCSTGNDANSSTEFTTMTNASLTSIAERMDNTKNTAGGGGFALDEGRLATAGSVGTWASTLTNASAKAYISFTLRSNSASGPFDQIYGTFAITDPGTSSTITKVEVGYEAFATATQKMNIYTSANGGSSWSSAHDTGNLATSDPNSYTYIDVTSDTTWTWALLNDTNFKAKAVTNWVSGTPAWSLDALCLLYTSPSPRD